MVEELVEKRSAKTHESQSTVLLLVEVGEAFKLCVAKKHTPRVVRHVKQYRFTSKSQMRHEGGELGSGLSAFCGVFAESCCRVSIRDLDSHWCMAGVSTLSQRS